MRVSLAVLLAMGAACSRVPTPLATATPVTTPSDGNVQLRPTDAVFVQQGYPRNDSAFVAPRIVEQAPPIAVADVAAVAIPAKTSPSWDIEVKSYENRSRVEHYLTKFTGPSRSYIQDRLAEGTRYESMIRSAMRAGGIPEDMYYLALVESGFDANAYSRAAAVGMWQFMSSTARGMGLRVDCGSTNAAIP